MKDFEELDAIVLGISPDSVASHRQFKNKFDLTVTLLSDPDSSALSDYGVWTTKTYDGVEYLGASRATFLIDPGGNLAHVWPDVSANGHALEVLEKLSNS